MVDKVLEIKLKKVFNEFKHEGKFNKYQELTSGHINTTYLIKTVKKPYYVLQQINHNVFKNVSELMDNKLAISEHLTQKFNHLPKKEQIRRVLTFIKAKSGKSYFEQEDGSFWGLTYFVDKSKTHLIPKKKATAYQAGLALGDFLSLTNDFNIKKLPEIIPKFHDMSFRYSEFENALKNAKEETIVNAKDYITLVLELKTEMHTLQKAKELGEIALRVTHNDTKISNILFDKRNKSLCVIDTDTVMPGIVHYDFGDATRTICNTSNEDEKDLEKVRFNVKFYKAFTKGFMKQIKSSLTQQELNYLPIAAKTMIFIIGLRFLTDYLNGNTYFKVAYPEHNFDRAKNQFKLLENLTEQKEKIKQIHEKLFKQNNLSN